ncbi:MAG: hypothetical protein HYX48_04920 [Chlamydiales bacterium]|nr:hypothetical protein [Chlamydiales bacterium]
MKIKVVSQPSSHESRGDREEPVGLALLPYLTIKAISIFACGRENQGSTFEREYRLLRRVCRSFRDALTDSLLRDRLQELFIRRTFPSLRGDRLLYKATQATMLEVLESGEFSVVERVDLFERGKHTRPVGDEGLFATLTKGQGRHDKNEQWDVREFHKGEKQFSFTSSSVFRERTQVLDRRFFRTAGERELAIEVRDLTNSRSQFQVLGKISRHYSLESFAVSNFFLAYGKFYEDQKIQGKYPIKINVTSLHSGKTRALEGFDDAPYESLGSSIYQHQLFLNLCYEEAHLDKYGIVQSREKKRGFTRVFDLRSDPKSMPNVVIPRTTCGNMARVKIEGVKEGVLIRTTLWGADGKMAGEALQIFDPVSFKLLRSFPIEPHDNFDPVWDKHWNSLNGSNLLLVGERALVLGPKTVSLYNLDNGKRQVILEAGSRGSYIGFQIHDAVLRVHRHNCAPLDIKLNPSASERQLIRAARQAQLDLERRRSRMPAFSVEQGRPPAGPPPSTKCIVS